MRALLRRIHRWCGLALAVPLVLQGLSGTILTLEPVLAGFAPLSATQGEPQPPGAILAAAQSAAGPELQATRYTPPAYRGDAALVHFAPLSGAVRGAGTDVQIDPVSLATLGQVSGSGGSLGWIRSLHTSLLIADRSGRSIIGWEGVGLLLLAMLGIPIWWPANGRWRAAVTLDANAHGWAFHRRLHGAAAIWTIGLLAATAATGTVLGFPQTTRSLLGLPEGGPPRAARLRSALEPRTLDLDRVLALAAEAVPGTRIRFVFLPSSAGEPVRVLLAPVGSEGVSGVSSVSVDAPGRRILAMQSAASLSLAERMLRWAHDLHFGQGFGPVWRALTVITGLLLPLFAATGAAMWWLRQRRRAPSQTTLQRAGE